MKNIALVGYYGAGNFGDELMLEGILQTLPDNIIASILSFGSASIKCPLPLDMHIENKSIRGERTLKNKIKALHKLFQSIGKADVILFGGGTIFFDKVDRGYKNLFGPLKVALVARVFRKKIIIYGCGIEELSLKISNHIVRFILNSCDTVYLRDEKSIDLAKQIGGHLQKAKLKKIFDPAYLVDYTQPASCLPLKKNKPIIIFCLMETAFRNTAFFSENRLLDILSEGIITFINAGYKILLLPMQENCLRNDNRTHQLFYDRLTNQQKTVVQLVKDISYEQKKKLLCSSDKIISMRYHPLVVGHIAGKNCLSLSVSGKSKQFTMHTFGIDNLVDLTQDNWEQELKKKIFLFATTTNKLSPTEKKIKMLAKEQFEEMIVTALLK